MEDTIAAVATAYGEGGIGIIRISGEKSLDILKSVFQPASGSDGIISRRMTYGKVIDDENRLVDEVLAVYMKGPKTYTAEDAVSYTHLVLPVPVWAQPSTSRPARAGGMACS